MDYVIVNSAGSKLSGHYPNAGPTGRLAYRRNDWYSFGTIRKAQEFLRSIQKRGYGQQLQIRKE